jgi:hypothetical protein
VSGDGVAPALEIFVSARLLRRPNGLLIHNPESIGCDQSATS